MCIPQIVGRCLISSYSACTAQHGRLHFSLDLLIADALSMRTLQQELMMLYREPHVSLPLLPFSFVTTCRRCW